MLSVNSATEKSWSPLAEPALSSTGFYPFSSFRVRMPESEGLMVTQDGQTPATESKTRLNKEGKMNYPFEEKDDEQLAIEDDLEMLREDLIGELQAINQYQQHVESLESEDAVAILEHIIEDEKEHVAELLKLIQNFDPVQAEKLRRQML